MGELGSLGANTGKTRELPLCLCICGVVQDLLGAVVTVKCELDIS